MWTQEMRHAVMALRRSPSFAFVAIVLLGVAIGANTAIFSVTHGVMLRPLPLHAPDALVRIWSSRPESSLPFFSVSPADVTDWRVRSRSFVDLAEYERQEPQLLQSLGQEVFVTRASERLFPLLGVKPALGRWFEPSDIGRGAPALISDSLWRRHFGARADVLGQPIVLAGGSRTIIGVMPATFAVPNAPSDVWLPLEPGLGEGNRSARMLRVVGRLRQGVTPDQARTELSQVASELASQFPATNAKWDVALRPLFDTVVSPEFRKAALFLTGAVALVLVMACANISALLLGRTSSRRRELAVRAAIGANRSAIVRLLMLESTVLAACAALVGLLLALAGIAVLKSLGADSVPRIDEIRLSLPVALFGIGASVVSVALFGGLPALKAAAQDAVALRSRDGSPDPATRRSRSALVVTEVALAVTLLIGAGFLIESFARLQQRTLGFDEENVLLVQVSIEADDATRPGRNTALIRQLAAAPQSLGAAATSSAPFFGPNSGNVLEIEGRPVVEGERADSDARVITPGYFAAMGVSVHRGRDFNDRDTGTSPVALVSAAAQRRYWPDRDPVGERMRLGDSEWLTIVGVVADVRHYGIGESEDSLRPMVYVPHTQMPGVPLTFVVKARSGSGDPTQWLRKAASDAGVGATVTNFSSLSSVVALARGPQRFSATLAGIFAAIALVLATAGLYALIAYLVAQRGREVGLRIALGAQSSDVLRLLAGQGLKLAVTGVCLGLMIAFGLARLMRATLFEVTTSEPTTYVVAAGGFLLVALFASYVPARRALRVDPVEALRGD